MKAKGEFSERDCFKMACRALFSNSYTVVSDPQRKIFHVDVSGLGKVEALEKLENFKLQLQDNVDILQTVETVPLYVLVSNGGDGSYGINFTMNQEWIDKQQENYDNGDVDYEYGIGIDGDGFSYSTIKVPKGSTLKSLGISYDCAED